MNEKEAKSVQAVLDKRNYRVSVLKHKKFANYHCMTNIKHVYWYTYM